MSSKSSVAIVVEIEDDQSNAPELEKIGRTIVVNVERHASLQTINDKIAERIPAFRDSRNTFYFLQSNGKYKQLISNCNPIWHDDLISISFLPPGEKSSMLHPLDELYFWCYHESTVEGFGLYKLHVNTVRLKHPRESCEKCKGGLYGRYFYFKCGCGGFHYCSSCIDDVAMTGCSLLKEIWWDWVTAPDAVVYDQMVKQNVWAQGCIHFVDLPANSNTWMGCSLIE